MAKPQFKYLTQKEGDLTMVINARFYLILSLALLSLGLYSCETMKGAGRDIEHTGESVQDAAN
jgi:predicted small secreted protein